MWNKVIFTLLIGVLMLNLAHASCDTALYTVTNDDITKKVVLPLGEEISTNFDENTAGSYITDSITLSYEGLAKSLDSKSIYTMRVYSNKSYLLKPGQEIYTKSDHEKYWHTLKLLKATSGNNSCTFIIDKETQVVIDKNRHSYVVPELWLEFEGIKTLNGVKYCMFDTSPDVGLINSGELTTQIIKYNSDHELLSTKYYTIKSLGCNNETPIETNGCYTFYEAETKEGDNGQGMGIVKYKDLEIDWSISDNESGWFYYQNNNDKTYWLGIHPKVNNVENIDCIKNVNYKQGKENALKVNDEDILCIKTALQPKDARFSVLIPDAIAKELSEGNHGKLQYKLLYNNDLGNAKFAKACNEPTEDIVEPMFCTDDAKICPDGSAVGRDYSNNCEFKQCPVVKNDKKYRYAKVQCNNGAYSQLGGETSCKPYSLWERYAKEYCMNCPGDENTECYVEDLHIYEECENNAVVPDQGNLQQRIEALEARVSRLEQIIYGVKKLLPELDLPAIDWEYVKPLTPSEDITIAPDYSDMVEPTDEMTTKEIKPSKPKFKVVNPGFVTIGDKELRTENGKFEVEDNKVYVVDEAFDNAYEVPNEFLEPDLGPSNIDPNPKDNSITEVIRVDIRGNTPVAQKVLVTERPSWFFGLWNNTTEEVVQEVKLPQKEIVSQNTKLEQTN